MYTCNITGTQRTNVVTNQVKQKIAAEFYNLIGFSSDSLFKGTCRVDARHNPSVIIINNNVNVKQNIKKIIIKHRFFKICSLTKKNVESSI